MDKDIESLRSSRGTLSNYLIPCEAEYGQQEIILEFNKDISDHGLTHFHPYAKYINKHTKILIKVQTLWVLILSISTRSHT